MTHNPIISVFLPFYNAECYIEEAIQSVLDQTFKLFELILINDGSTDSSEYIIKKFKDPRIRYIASEHNFIRSSNIGIESSQGKYLARMDADDIMMPERLQIQYDFMESHPEIAACGSYIELFGMSHGILTRPTSPEELSYAIFNSSPIAQPTAIIRKSILEENHIRYNPQYIYAEDYKLWTDIIKYGKLANIPQVLLKYKVSPTQLSIKKRREQAEMTKRIEHELIAYHLNFINTHHPLGKNVEKFLLSLIRSLKKEELLSEEDYWSLLSILVPQLKKHHLID